MWKMQDIVAPESDGSGVNVVVADDSERLQLLTPFVPLGTEINNAKLLIKAHGKCTTDHISMAGPWLRYRGHLDNISNNCLIGAVNAFNMKTDCVKISSRENMLPCLIRSEHTKQRGYLR